MNNITKDISFVILTWNSESYIKKCIDSIVFALENSAFSYEIFLIDNGSKDKTTSVLYDLQNQHTDFVKLILLDKNMGTTYSRNLALKKSMGNYICIMDSDVVLSSGTIDKLIKILQSDTDVGLAVPRVVYPNGNLQKSIDTFPTIARKIYRYLFLKSLESREAFKFFPEAPVEVDYAISALWLIKRKVVIDVGLLDENIFYSPEDVDYCIRIWKKGYKIIYDNSVSVVHHTQEISRGFKINKAFINHIKGLIYYFLKHKYFFIKPSFKK